MTSSSLTTGRSQFRLGREADRIRQHDSLYFQHLAAARVKANRILGILEEHQHASRVYGTVLRTRVSFSNFYGSHVRALLARNPGILLDPEPLKLLRRHLKAEIPEIKFVLC